MNLDLPLPRIVERIGAAVADAGGRAFVVGGGVRDHLLGRAVKDWDVEVHGLSLDRLEDLLRGVGRVNAVGRSFGVFKVSTRGGREIDVSIPRRDSKVGPGHRGISVEGDPDMTPEESVRRRDLTINAMMVDVVDGGLLDPAGGLTDLRARQLRAVDDTTFLEDPLRALRVVQFAARFGFSVDPSLEALCAAASVDELPAERILGEWVKLALRGHAPAHGLDLARRTGLLARLFPERVDTPSLDAALDRLATGPGPTLSPEGRRLAAFLTTWLAHTPPADAEATLDRLGLFRWLGYPCRDRILAALPELTQATPTPAWLRHLSTRAEPELVLTVQHVLRPTDPAPTAALALAADLGVLHDKPDPLVQGRDLIALGVRPGPAMGEQLKSLYARQLDGELHNREEALTAARESLSG